MLGAVSAFKAYDIRGQLGTELNEDIAYRIARAFARFLKPRRAGGGRQARDVEQILDAIGDTGERAGILTRRDPGVDRGRFLQGANAHRPRDGIDSRVPRGDPAERRLGEIHGR